MTNLSIQELTFTYPNAVEPVFSHATFQLETGWTGVAGANGGGKSTLLKTLCGIYLPEEGRIHPKASGLYVEQRTDFPPDSLEAFMERRDKEAFRLRELLGVQYDWLWRWETLSHGERKRAQLAAALYADPPLLALDEPTNHLDAPSRQMVEEAMESYDGIGVVVSHDRHLLDRLCRHTLFVEEGRVEWRKCSYAAAKEERDRERAFARKSGERHAKEVKKLKRQVADQRARADRSDGRVSKGRVDPKDKDAKARIDLARLTGKDAVDTKKLGKLEHRLERTEGETREIKREFETGIRLEAGEHYGLFPLVVEPCQLPLDGERVLQVPRLVIHKKERIGVTGPNGAGKSTLVRHLLEQGEFRPEAVLYLPQEIGLEASEKLLNQVKELDPGKRGWILSLLVRLGSDPAALLQSSLPSPGEARKLMLALGLLRQPGLIVMDEPTNHLDIVAVEALETALNDYEGALLLVSHDQRFLEHTVERRWVLEPGESGTTVAES